MTKKVLLNILGLFSSDSAIDIDMNLEKIDGVIESNTSSVQQQTELTFNPKTANLAKIINAVKKLGYDVELVTETA